MAFQSFKSTVEEGVRGSSEVLMGSFITANPLLLPPHLPWPEREEATKDLQNFKQKRLFNPKMFFQITCFMIGYVLTQPVRFAHVVVKG